MEGMQDGNGNSYFCEPSGLAIDPSCKQLYVADTNNHEVKAVSLDDASVKKVSRPVQYTLQPEKDRGCNAISFGLKSQKPAANS